MDPLTLAGGFATIVGLICNFKSENKGQNDNQINSFLIWLSESHHKEIKELIESNTNISSSIEQILDEDREVFLEKLQKIDDILSSFASKVDIFGNLAIALKPQVEISDQAINILKQLVHSQASGFIELTSMQEVELLLLEGPGTIEFEDHRFLKDDLSNLIEYCLLRAELNRSGDRIFRITRNAIKFIEAIEK